jgi:hypothetical protein
LKKLAYIAGEVLEGVSCFFPSALSWTSVHVINLEVDKTIDYAFYDGHFFMLVEHRFLP